MSIDVSFSDQSTAGPSGPITAWAWDFGDTGTSTEQNPIHTYAAAGTYPVSLTVTGTGTDGTATASHLVTVSDAGGSPTGFVAATDWPRPAFTPVRSVPFTTKAQLDAALTDMQAGDRIYYNGTGVLTISSSSTIAYTIANKNPASTVVIDFGCSRNIWDGTTITGDYVKFAYTGSSNVNAVSVHDCSNLRIYGGDITTGIGGVGIIINALTHNLIWYDFVVHNVGSSGVSIRGSTGAGVASSVYNLTLRGEVDRFAMNPSWDTHNDKGTGMHGLILHGSSGNINRSTWAIYAHDPLAPGEVSAGKTWGEGGGGSAIEAGNNYGNNDSNTYYVFAENMLMQPDGHSNPGSTGTGQTGGNAINWWGNSVLNNNIVGWAEATNCTGAVSHGVSGSWHTGTPPVTFQHGRSTNVNQYTGGGNISEPYDSGWGIVYNDCT